MMVARASLRVTQGRDDGATRDFAISISSLRGVKS
jgi:hypothetical protein